MIPCLGNWGCDERHAMAVATSLSMLSASDVVALQAAYGDSSEDPPYSLLNGIAILPLSGTLVKDGGWWLKYLGATSTSQFAAAVRQADADPAVKAILIECDSPGGQVSGTPEAAEAVAEAKKPVIAMVRGLCCSCAYWICSQADQLWGRPESQSANIGCYTFLADTTKMHERIGIAVKVYRSGPHKGVGIGGTETTAEQDAEIQKAVDGIATLFRKAVASGRKMKADKVDSLADGRAFLGAEAASLGLIDGVAGHDAVMSALRAYAPGRRAIKIAAAGGTGGFVMSRWDDFKKWLEGDEGDAGNPTASIARTAPLDGLATLQPVLLQGSVVADSRVAQLEAELARERAEKQTAIDAAAKQTEALNRTAVEACFREGKITREDIEAHVALRAQSPTLYDTLMAQKPSHPLTPPADRVSGEEAATQQTPEGTFLDEVAKYVKTNHGGRTAAKNGATN